MTATLVLALAFALLLGVEWRYRLRSMRLAAASLALVALFLAQPAYTRAARRAFAMPPSERVTHIRGERLSEYVSGVRTMEHTAWEDSQMGANARLLSVAVLFWLACSPLLRRERRTGQDALS